MLVTKQGAFVAKRSTAFFLHQVMCEMKKPYLMNISLENFIRSSVILYNANEK
jgi:hypothetical protein